MGSPLRRMAFDYPHRLAAVVLTIAVLAGCTSSPDQVAVDATVSDGGAQLDGDAEFGTTIRVPDGTLPVGATVTATGHVDAPDPGGAFEPLGPSVQIEVSDGQGPVRPDGLLSMTFSFEPGAVTEAGQLVVAYADPNGAWHLLDPATVDLDAGVVTIMTDHLSPWRLGRLTTEQQTARFAERAAVTSYVRTQSIDASERQISASVEAILREGAGVSDNRVIEIVTRAVVAQAPGGAIALALSDLDPEAFEQAMLSETASVLGAMVMDDESPVATALGSVGAAATAAGQAAGGDGWAAAQTIGVQIAGVFGGGRLIALGEAAAELTNHAVNDLWLDPTLDKAFEAYRDGAEGTYGYDVDAGDFEAVLGQMTPGALRQLHINYISAYSTARGWDPDSLSSGEREALRREAEQQLQERFDARIERGPEIARREAAILDMYGAFQDRGMFITSDANPMIPDGAEMDHETLMERILRFSSRVQRDTGRYIIDTSDGFAARHDDGTHLPAYIVASAALAWYTAAPEEREQAYRQVLVEEGFLEPEEEEDDLQDAALRLGEAYCAAAEGRRAIMAEDPNPSWNAYYEARDPRYMAGEEFQELAEELREEIGPGFDFQLESGIHQVCPEMAG